MHQGLLLLTAMTFVSLPAQAARFTGTKVEGDGSSLVAIRSDGSTFSVPKIDDQDGFQKPAVSANGRYVGWLAIFPNRGASYSQPLHLAVLGSSAEIRRFAGDFGMVYGWCFTLHSDAVIYKYQFPHGATPIGFSMRRLSDGKLLRQVRLEPIDPNADETKVIRTKAPTWTKCAQESAAVE